MRKGWRRAQEAAIQCECSEADHQQQLKQAGAWADRNHAEVWQKWIYKHERRAHHQDSLNLIKVSYSKDIEFYLCSKEQCRCMVQKRGFQAYLTANQQTYAAMNADY